MSSSNSTAQFECYQASKFSIPVLFQENKMANNNFTILILAFTLFITRSALKKMRFILHKLLGCLSFHVLKIFSSIANPFHKSSSNWSSKTSFLDLPLETLIISQIPKFPHFFSSFFQSSSRHLLSCLENG